jgi:hypothetical protein
MEYMDYLSEMKQSVPSVLSEVIGRTNSDLIIFFVLLIVFLIVYIPLYRMKAKQALDKLRHEQEHAAGVLRHEKELEISRADREADRTREILTVITNNTKTINHLNLLITELTARNEHNQGKILDGVEVLRREYQKKLRRFL